MKAAEAPPAPGPGADAEAEAEAEALIREARRRQRRRYLVTGLAVLTAVAGVFGGLAGLRGASQPRTRGPQRPRPAATHFIRPPAPGPIPGSVGTTVLMWPVGYPAFSSSGGPPAYVDNLRTGHLGESQRPNIGAGDYQPLLTQVGHWLVYVGNGATAIRDDLKGRPRVLGKTPFFAPSAVPGHVWLIYLPRHGRDSVRSVAVSGGPPGPAIVLPRRTQLIEGTDAGLLLQSRIGGLELWVPGAMPTALPDAGHTNAYSDVLDATPRLVAYGTGCGYGMYWPPPDGEAASYRECRMLRVFDARTGRVDSFRAPARTAGWVPNGVGLDSAISPGNRMIAAEAAIPGIRAGRVRVYVLRLTGVHRRPVVVPSSSAPPFARTAWSTGGSWLFYQGPSQHMWAYQVSTGRVRSSGTPCCQYTVMATIKSPPG